MSQTIKDSALFYYESIREIKDVRTTSDAFDFFKKKAQNHLKNKDSIKAAYYLELISWGQFKMTFYNESESTTIKAFTLLNAVKNNPKTIEPRKRLLNHLGMIYRELQDFEKSLKYYEKALQLNSNLIDKITIITNVANVYADQKQFDRAVNELTKYYNAVLTMEDSNIKATYLDNLGYYQSKTDITTGLKSMNLALQIRLQLEDITHLFSSYKHLFLFYLEQGNRTKAKTYALKMEDLSNKMGTTPYKLEALASKLKLEHNRDFSNYIALSEASKSENLLRQNKYAAIKYDVEQKEKSIKEKELKLNRTQLEKEEQRTQKSMYQFIVVLGMLFSVFLYVLIKIKHKKDKILQVYNTEVRISKKVHDEVANDVYHIMTKLEQNKKVADDVLDDLEGIYNKTRDISKENNIIDIHEDYGNHLKDLLLSYKSDKVNIITKDIDKVNWNHLHETKKFALYRVLQELMTNMRKHSNATLVVLKFNQDNRKISVSYKDNGIGCNLIKNNGLHNTENRMESVKGSITFDSQPNKGFSAHIIV